MSKYDVMIAAGFTSSPDRDCEDLLVTQVTNEDASPEKGNHVREGGLENGIPFSRLFAPSEGLFRMACDGTLFD